MTLLSPAVWATQLTITCKPSICGIKCFLVFPRHLEQGSKHCVIIQEIELTIMANHEKKDKMWLRDLDFTEKSAPRY